MRRAWLLLLALSGTLACRDEQKPAPNPVPSASASAATKLTLIPQSRTKAHDIESLVTAWNNAINAHDTEKLADLYADEIELYGKKMSRTAALAAKKQAFTTHDHDDLTDVRVDEHGRARFTKKSKGTDGKVIEVVGYLDADRSGSVWKIVSEGDTTTDANLSRKKTMTCMGAVSALVDATPQAKKAMKDIAHLGGMVNEPTDSATGLWHVALCENQPDRFLCLDHFEVDPTTALITYSGIHEDLGEKPTPDPTLAAAVRSVCK